jgi:hypothetical protein
MADAYIIETIEEHNERFGDSRNDDLHGGLHLRHRLQHAPNDQFPSYLIIQTSGGDIGDNWVAPNALDDFTVTSIQILYRPL